MDRVEVLQTLDGHLYLDVAHPRADHSEDDDEERDDSFDDCVCEVSRLLELLVVPHVQRFLYVIIIKLTTEVTNFAVSLQSGKYMTNREAAWCIISVVSVCLSVCQTITLKSLDLGSSYLHIWVKFVYEGHGVKIKVT